jgi:hypothetical protein
MSVSARMMRSAFLSAALALVALPAPALASHIRPDPGVMEIEQFTMDPLDPAAGPVPISFPRNPLTGTVSSSADTLTGTGTHFTTELIPGTVVYTAANGGEATSVREIISDVQARIDPAFSPALPAGTTLYVNDVAASVPPLLTQAGGHPNMRLFMRFCDPDPFADRIFAIDVLHGCSSEQNKSQRFRQLKDFKISLPPGSLGNPTALAVCPTFLWLASACPPESQLGASLSQTITETLPAKPVAVQTPVFNVQTLGLEPARLGTNILPSTPPTALPVFVTLRTDGDFGIDSAVLNIPKALGGPEANVQSVDNVLCAQAPCQATNTFNPSSVQPLDAATAKPFFVNPTSCDKPMTATLTVDSWGHPETLVSATSQYFGFGGQQAGFPRDAVTPTGCDTNVPFSPTVEVNPTKPGPTGDAVVDNSSKAGASSGYRVSIKYQQKDNQCDPAVTKCVTYENDTIWQAALKNAFVTLPRGITLAAGGGAGLQSCTAEEFGVDLSTTPVKQTNDPAQCPEASQIGTLRVVTPVLPDPLQGKAFFGPTSAPGRPTAASPWKLFFLIEGAGLRIKLVGDVTLCAGDGNPVAECKEDGQVRNVFLNQPEVPFSTFQVDLRGGPNAILQNPRNCDANEGAVRLEGYNGGVAPSTPSVTPTTNCNQAFAPVLEEASAKPEQAGAMSTSHLVFSRPDDNELLAGLKLSLPPGATGSLAASPQCSKEVVLKLQSDPTANCPDSTKVGIIRTTVGSDEGNLVTSGSLYIGEAVRPGDAASFVIVVPAKVGPIDLGRVIVINNVVLRPKDIGVDVISGPIPTILEGIPLPVKRIEIAVDRDNFFLNPTGCDKRTFTATFTSDKGSVSNSSVQLDAKGCERLGFAPRLRLIAGAKGATATNAKVPLKAIVTQNSSESNISTARVVIPDLIRPNVPALQRPGGLCNDAQLAARACPASSQIGTSSVVTPLLPFTLSGPVYIVLKAGSPLPNLAIFLRGGGFEVPLSANNGFQGIKILNTFPSLPDVAQSRFELTVKGGPNGILLAHSNLCTTRPLPAIDATFTGHNGKTFSEKPKLEVNGCQDVGQSGTVSIAKKSVKVTKKGIAPIKLRCAPGKACKGRLSMRSATALRSVFASKARKVKLGSKSFSIAAGKTKTVKVKLTKTGKRVVFKYGRVAARLTLKPAGKKARHSSVTLRAPRRR